MIGRDIPRLFARLSVSTVVGRHTVESRGETTESIPLVFEIALEYNRHGEAYHNLRNKCREGEAPVRGDCRRRVLGGGGGRYHMADDCLRKGHKCGSIDALRVPVLYPKRVLLCKCCVVLCGSRAPKRERTRPNPQPCDCRSDTFKSEAD